MLAREGVGAYTSIQAGCVHALSLALLLALPPPVAPSWRACSLDGGSGGGGGGDDGGGGVDSVLLLSLREDRMYL